MKNPKMLTFCEMDFPIFRVARGALRVEGKNLFFDQKNSKMTKIAPNSLKSELKMCHLVPCSFKETTAKI